MSVRITQLGRPDGAVEQHVILYNAVVYIHINNVMFNRVYCTYMMYTLHMYNCITLIHNK